MIATATQGKPSEITRSAVLEAFREKRALGITTVAACTQLQVSRPTLYRWLTEESAENWARILLRSKSQVTARDVATHAGVTVSLAGRVLERVKSEVGAKGPDRPIDHENPPDATKSEPLLNSTTAASAKPGSSAREEV